MAEEHRVDYHAGLVAALKTKYDDQYDFMETIKELILGEKPPRLDAVVLKKAPEHVLTDEIGCFFKEHNVFEFKGYGDGISINDVYKTEAYAFLYMVIDKAEDEIPFSTMTLTVIQYRYPREVFKKLENLGSSIKARRKGIYEVSGGPVAFPFQIVDADELGDEWTVLKVLVPGATKEQIDKIQKEYEQVKGTLLGQHLEDVLRTSFESNEELFTKMKEAGQLSEAVERVFKKEIEEAAERKTEENRVQDIRSIMASTGWTPQKTMEIMNIPVDKRARYAKMV